VALIAEPSRPSRETGWARNRRLVLRPRRERRGPYRSAPWLFSVREDPARDEAQRCPRAHPRNVRAGSPMRSATRSWSLRPSACIGGRPKGREGHCGLLRTNCRRWATAIGVARRTRHRALSRWWRGRLLERTPVDFGGVILEPLVVPHHLVPSTQSSTSAGRGRSVTSLAMC
jgi:hypothetical protein